MKIPLTLGYDSQERKDTPMLAVVFGYFAAAMRGLTEHAVRSNEKHNKGEPLHWARGKSMDHAECELRHLVDSAEMAAWLRRNVGHADYETVLTMLQHEHDARVWRAAADSQQFYEEFRGAPLSFSSRLPPPVAPPAPASLPIFRYEYELPPAGATTVFPQAAADAAADDLIGQIVSGNSPLHGPAAADWRASPIDRAMWPPLVRTNAPVGQPDVIWPTDNDTFYFNRSDAPNNSAASGHSYSTEHAARAAYWADRDAQSKLPLDADYSR